MWKKRKKTVSFELPAEIVEGLVFIKARLNGNAVQLCLDTGSSVSAIDVYWACKLGLTRVGATKIINAFGNEAACDVVKINSLIVGGLEIRNLQACALEMPVGLGDGLIGANALKNLAVTMDFPRKKVKLESDGATVIGT